MKKFDIVENGYDKKQVIDFVDDVIYKLQNYMLNIATLEQENKRLKLEVDNISRTKGLINDTYDITKQETSEIISLAEEKSSEIIRHAKKEAISIINEAILKSEKIEVQSHHLEKNVRVFKHKLKVFMEGQLEQVEEIDKTSY